MLCAFPNAHDHNALRQTWFKINSPLHTQIRSAASLARFRLARSAAKIQYCTNIEIELTYIEILNFTIEVNEVS